MPDDASQVNLAWPPAKEDLERLYLVEKLSAEKIARVYGLKYKNPKVAESTILYQLKKKGIARRDRAEHVRKVTVEMVDEWVRRYQAGESLKRIADEIVDPVTVWNHLRARGIALRDKVEAQIQSVTKYAKTPFSRDRIERAYLMGLRYGDLHVVRHGRAIRVRVSTTHPAMADLFESVFSANGHVHRYPREAKLVEYEWSLECDLDETFEFLLFRPSIRNLKLMTPGETIAFLAGLFDTEGSVLLHRKNNRHTPEIAFSNFDKKLVDFIFSRLRLLGFSAHVYWRKQPNDRRGITGESATGRVAIWRIEEVQRFLGIFRIRHPEKVAKAELVRTISSREVDGGILAKWRELKAQIGSERSHFLDLAAQSIRNAKSRKHKTRSE